MDCKKLSKWERERRAAEEAIAEAFPKEPVDVGFSNWEPLAPKQRVEIKSARLEDNGPIEPNPRLGKRRSQRQKKQEREKTKGSKWYNLPAAEIDDKKKYDLQALKLRKAIDSKSFYKRNNMPTTPKYFQVGRVVENPADFYHSRIPKKQRKTIAQELLEGVDS